MAIRTTSEKQLENNNRRAIYSKLTKWMWIAVAIFLLAIAILFFTLSRSGIPSFEELENPDIDYASIVFDDSGGELGRYYRENRVAVPYDSLNPFLVEALIATEDSRYFRHSGIDFKSIGRVVFKTILLRQKSSGGGSTITQQLAKQLYSFRNYEGMNKIQKGFALTFFKLKEWITAVLLERSYTKEEIISMYLSEYDFIYSSHGIEAAAKTYFGKPQKELELDEAAVLIGMLKNSVLYNPVRFPTNATNRRNVVLDQMTKAGSITRTELDSLIVKPLDISKFQRADHISGDATYFRAYVNKWVQSLIRDNDIKKSDGTLYNIYTDGLRIYTTIDSRMQTHLQDAVQEHMAVNQERFFTHWKGRDIWGNTGDNYPVDIKKADLQRLMRESDRFKLLQSKYLSVKISELQNEFNVTLFDYDLPRLIEASKDANYLKGLEQKKLITESKADVLRRIVASDHWPAFKTAWEDMEAAVDKSFNTAVEMKVFAYNKKMEADTVMTPLDSIKYHRMILQVGSLAVNPKNGYVKAWVGGVDHKYFKFDHINSRRQVGSTFKPFIYSTAISLQGFSPCFPVMDIQYSILPNEGNFQLIDAWRPENTGGEYSRENITLYEALRKSVNSVSVYLIKQMGDTEPVRGIVHNMGIDSSKNATNGRYLIPKLPSIALGAADLSVMEMTGAYATFANNGKYTKPVIVTKIMDRNGKVLYQNVPHTQVALNSTVNYVMVDMLRKIAPPGITFKSDVGGKTGTTNDHSDGWYMGITPNVVVGTWVGGEDRWMRFRTITYGQGSQMARPIFAKFIKALEDDPQIDYDAAERFYRPRGDLEIEIDCDKYKRSHPADDHNKVFERMEDNSGGFF